MAKTSGSSTAAGLRPAPVYVPFLKRNHYFHGKVLTAKDLADEQHYHREKMRLHNRVVHGWGVVQGLDLGVEGNRIVVSPGLAIDTSGRELVATCAVTLPVPAQKHTWFVTVQYAERETDPVAATSDDTGTHNARIEEGIEVALSSEVPRERAVPDPSSEARPLCIGKVQWSKNAWRARRATASHARIR